MGSSLRDWLWGTVSEANAVPRPVRARIDCKTRNPHLASDVQRRTSALRSMARLHWTVVELDAGMVPGSRGARCLVFARQECIRRVWDFPGDWRTLDAAGLLELSWHR
jgi:hypothetical protein